MKDTHDHRILQMSVSTFLVLVKRRKLNKKWYELKLRSMARHNWFRVNTVEGQTLDARNNTRRALKRLYDNDICKFHTLKAATQAYTWVLLNRE